MRAPPYPIGLNVHALTAAHIAALGRLGVRQVRWTLYWSEWDHDDAQRAAAYRAHATRQLERARDAGLELLICAHGAPGRYGDHWTHRTRLLADFETWLAARVRQWPGLTWQPWNEPDGPTFTNAFLGAGHDPLGAGRRYGAHVASLLRGLPAKTRIATAGLGTSLDGGFVDGMTEGLGDAPIVGCAVHCYGLPPANALASRVARVRHALRTQARTTPVWVTEFGVSDVDMRDAWRIPRAQWDDRQAVEWASAARQAEALGVGRLYGYVLDAGDARGYGILRGDGGWRATAAWVARHQRGAT